MYGEIPSLINGSDDVITGHSNSLHTPGKTLSRDQERKLIKLAGDAFPQLVKERTGDSNNILQDIMLSIDTNLMHNCELTGNNIS